MRRTGPGAIGGNPGVGGPDGSVADAEGEGEADGLPDGLAVGDGCSCATEAGPPHALSAWSATRWEMSPAEGASASDGGASCHSSSAQAMIVAATLRPRRAVGRHAIPP